MYQALKPWLVCFVVATFDRWRGMQGIVCCYQRTTDGKLFLRIPIFGGITLTQQGGGTDQLSKHCGWSTELCNVYGEICVCWGRF